jgi:hypothetical protein
LASLEEIVVRTRRVILEAPLRRWIHIIIIICMVVILLSLVLLDVDLLNYGVLLSREWVWRVFVVEMHIIVQIADGVVKALDVARTTRSRCAERTQIVR